MIDSYMTLTELRRRFSSVELAGLTAFGEAEGERVEGQIAVLNVIRNRADRRRVSMGSIALEPHQFSCWWEDNDHTKRLFALAETIANAPADVAAGGVLRQCLALASLIDGRVLLDNTAGATFYLTDTLYHAAPPTWAIDRTPCAQIGRHLFFKGIAPYL